MCRQHWPGSVCSAASMVENRFPPLPGSYLLWLFLPRGVEIEVGRFGCRHFKRGWYFYSGSAFGPGGLRARLGRHLRASERRHWHIDYFKEQARIRAVWLCRGVNLEHDWSYRLLQLPDAELPVAGFGSSDCACPSHLVYLPTRPDSATMIKILAGEQRIERYNVSAAGLFACQLCRS